MTRLALRLDPYAIFSASPTPPGLYARLKWLHETPSAKWQTDFDATVAGLYRGQSADGLWNGSVIETIQHLFGLHLTVRNPDSRINTALDRLLEIAAGRDTAADEGSIGPSQLIGLPFAPSRWSSLVVPATLFLASIFGRTTDPSVTTLYRRLAADLTAADMALVAPAGMHNRLRALVVHPAYADHQATRAAVAGLARRQTPRGDWGDEIPFFQALNALAHLAFAEADKQCRKAFDLLVKTQNPDGSWGKSEPQWCTFLAVHALRNKGLL